ncbi:MAG: hypothetical protein LBQ14_00715 [Treponema sp.]|jgi:hypothetical protein|nr:hypothetical protein [Treponema sp.]
MSTNKYRNHLVIYTEDNATSQLAESFLNNDGFNRYKANVLPPCRGWNDAVESAIRDTQLGTGLRRVVVLIDLDKQNCRINEIRKKIPPQYADKIFVIGWSGKIENLKSALACSGKGFEKLGEKLAQDCLAGCRGAWESEYFSQFRDAYYECSEKQQIQNLIDLLKN